MGNFSGTIAAAFSSPLRSQGRHWCLALALSTWFSSTSAQTIISVSVDDPRMVYFGNWTDQDNGGHKVTVSPGATLSFTFTGTGISYVSRHNWQGGAARIQIDDQSATLVDESTNTTINELPQEDILFSKSGLDGSQSHTFKLSYGGFGLIGGPSVEVYGLEYVQTGIAPTSLASSNFSVEPQTAATSSATSTLSSSTTSPSPSSLSNRSKSSRSALIGGIVGGILGGVLGGVLLSLLALCFFRRRAARRRQREIDLERRAQPYTLRTDTADGRRHDTADSTPPVGHKGMMPTLSVDTVNDASHPPMQQNDAGLAPVLGPRDQGLEATDSNAMSAVRMDRQQQLGLNESAGPAPTGSDGDSHGHPPSYSQVPPRYASRRLPRIRMLKM